MHNRIIKFNPIDGQTEDDICRYLLECIHGWGIKNVIMMRADNASSIDKALEYLIRKLPNLYDGGKHFPVRCMAHILNLIVKDGLKEHNYHVDCVTNAIRYIRLSSQRISKFKKCMQYLGKRFLCGDCATRRNSTHDMLKIVVELKEVFFAYDFVDDNYVHDFARIPT
ncbi:zinc finger BED domain-containing protein RICESLEEPER 3-like [Rutidosis leptorrhynchoides]|uniref:zinc finger BED domain-containing protein RICESLEEPER 3-like n=1 Tax=Rutidosis leptorrhynchoides TaxID=125765 RepID=UPI003A99C1DB